MRLTTIAKGAAELDLSERTVYRLMDEGKLTKYQLEGGRAVRVDMDQLYSLFMPEGVTYEPEEREPEPPRPIPERADKHLSAWDRKRLDTLDYIRDYTKAHGESPSIPAIAKHFGMSWGGVESRLKRMEEMGMIRIYTPVNSKEPQYIVMERGTA